MKHTHLRPALVAGFLALAYSASAQVLFTGSYSQNFDTLPGSGTSTFTNNTTLTGWYAQHNGTSSGGTALVFNGALDSTVTANNPEFGLYSLGTSSERAFGSRPNTATSGNIYFGLRLTNNTASTINTLTVSYTGEQWSTPQTGTSVVTSVEGLFFSYKVGSASIGDTSGFTSNSAGDFPIVQTDKTQVVIDGNSSANQRLVSISLSSLNWAPGSDIWVRWQDINDSATADTLLGIDNLSITAGTIPEPSAFAAIAGLGALACSALRRRRRA